jgi:hypothetical protein
MHVGAGIVTGYGLDGRGFDSCQGQDIFLYSRQALRPTQLLIQWVPGALPLGVKRRRREANHSSPSNAKVKNGGPMPPLRMSPWRRDNFIAYCLIKHRKTLTLPFTFMHVYLSIIIPHERVYSLIGQMKYFWSPSQLL